MRRNPGTNLSAAAVAVLLGGCLVVAAVDMARAQSGAAGGSIAGEGRDLSGQRNEQPDPSPGGDTDSFDGSWLFAGAGCRSSGVLPAIIAHEKLIFQGGSGRVDPDGTVNSIGAGNGITQTAVGRLTGNTGTGTFKRSDGCRGTWTAIKQ